MFWLPYRRNPLALPTRFRQRGMLLVPTGGNAFGLATPSYGTTRPTASMGTSITPGTGGYGSYVTVQAALAYDAYGLLICLNNWAASAASRNGIVTIGIDPAGGSSFVDTIPDLICGGCSPYTVGSGGVWYYFPIFIPAGSTIGAKAYGTVINIIKCFTVAMQKPSNPSQIRKGSFVEAIGTSTNVGTALTPGTTSEGSWTLMGTTSKRLWWWQLGFQVGVGDTSWGATGTHVDLAVGDASNKQIVIQDQLFTLNAQEQLANPPLTAGVEFDTPAGTNVYMRAQNSGTNESAYGACAYGLGG